MMDGYSVEQERARTRRKEGRPDPEDLLRRYGLQDHKGAGPSASPFSPTSLTIEQKEISTEGDSHCQRGWLRVYLAAAAGAGKTYAMLNEGHRRESRGTDVVVGYVETHGRLQTQAQLGGLEVVPRMQISSTKLPSSVRFFVSTGVRRARLIFHDRSQLRITGV
jgi:two-component system sensor histidine kinase KdpD